MSAYHCRLSDSHQVLQSHGLKMREGSADIAMLRSHRRVTTLGDNRGADGRNNQQHPGRVSRSGDALARVMWSIPETAQAKGSSRCSQSSQRRTQKPVSILLVHNETRNCHVASVCQPSDVRTPAPSRLNIPDAGIPFAAASAGQQL